MKTILLLEDDKNLNTGITVALQREGYKVFSVFLVREAENIFMSQQIDMVISDISLPDGNGLDFGSWVRERSNVCFLYLTALNTEEDMVKGYANGADDYVVKPFSLAVLTSKVNAMMKRLAGGGELTYTAGELVVRTGNAIVYQGSQEIRLTKTEYKLLLMLLENAGNILLKETLLEKIWDGDGRFVEDSTVTVNISRLKSKLGTKCIENVRGLGYLWNGPVVKK